MYISIFCVYETHVESKALYDELESYKFDVTDAIKSVFVYGRIHERYLSKVLMILLKYGDANITITK